MQQEKGVDRGDINLYLLSKDSISEINLYSRSYVWILLAIFFILFLFLGFILLLGLIFVYYLCCWIFAKLLGEPKEKEFEKVSIKEISTKTKVTTIKWEDITKAEVKGQYLDLYINGKRRGLFIKSDKKRMLDLLSLKLKDKLVINDKK